MLSLPSTLTAPSTVQWTHPPLAKAFGTAERAWSEHARTEWLAAFILRFGALRPRDDKETVMALAAELWDDLCDHDPVVCAEMEFEARAFDG